MFQKQLVIFLLLLVLAGFLRFYKLGEWSFGFDELFTTLEAKILFGEASVPAEYLRNGTVKPEDTQYYRLPRLLCGSYAVHRLDYELFGEDEWGSRVLPAILGTLSVGVIFLLAQPLIGFAGAIILALLVMLLPEHILHCQCNRFYIQSFFLISAVMLLGGRVAVQRSSATALWLGLFATLMVLSNSFGGIMWGGVLLAILVNILCSKKSGEPLFTSKTRNVLLILTMWSVILFGIFVFHIIPLAAGWNAGSVWGYTTLHAVMAFVNTLGWSLSLLALLGIGMILFNFRNNNNSYWLVLILVSGISILLLPFKIVYNPFYGFLFSFPFLVAAAIFVREVYRLLLESSLPFRSLIAVVWVAVALFQNFPSLYSYYQDGNRADQRAAFQFVAEHWEDGDCLTGTQMGTAQYYIPNNTPRIPLRSFNTAEKLQTIYENEIDDGNRLWIVLPSWREGLDFELRQWLCQHALLQASFSKKRFDYIENNLDVFLVPKKTRIEK
ncbi:MAG: glycosyltransferase family 39 protein [Planctomycetaceae bacterium]|jgi:hypothetical protein|nr:glycosyltransferase family 39 protein [Planctomycetaceae bacterium]